MVIVPALVVASVTISSSMSAIVMLPAAEALTVSTLDAAEIVPPAVSTRFVASSRAVLEIFVFAFITIRSPGA